MLSFALPFFFLFSTLRQWQPDCSLSLVFRLGIKILGNFSSLKVYAVISFGVLFAVFSVRNKGAEENVSHSTRSVQVFVTFTSVSHTLASECVLLSDLSDSVKLWVHGVKLCTWYFAFYCFYVLLVTWKAALPSLGFCSKFASVLSICHIIKWKK